MRKNEPVPGKIYRLTGEANAPCIAAGNDWEECVVDPVKENIHKLIEDINEHDGESFRVVWDGVQLACHDDQPDSLIECLDFCTLYNGSTKITDGSGSDIETRLRQIRRENGIM